MQHSVMRGNLSCCQRSYRSVAKQAKVMLHKKSELSAHTALRLSCYNETEALNTAYKPCGVWNVDSADLSPLLPDNLQHMLLVPI